MAATPTSRLQNFSIVIEGIRSNVYHKWLKDFMEAGKARLKGDIA